MSATTLLSLGVGIPVAAVALLLLFRIEAGIVVGRRISRVLLAAATASTTLVLVLITARFLRYA